MTFTRVIKAKKEGYDYKKNNFDLHKEFGVKKDKMLIIFLFLLIFNYTFAQKIECNQYHLNPKYKVSENMGLLKMFELDSSSISFYLSDIGYINEYLCIYNQKKDIFVIYHEVNKSIQQIKNKSLRGKKIINFLSNNLHKFPKKTISIFAPKSKCLTSDYHLTIKYNGLLKGNIFFSSCCYSSNIENSFLGIEGLDFLKEDIFLTPTDIKLIKEIINFFRDVSNK